MKKIALFLTIVAIGVMVSGDVLAQRRGGGRGGGRSGGGRPGAGGPQINRSAPRSIQMNPTQRFNSGQRPSANFANPTQRSGAGRISPQRRISPQQRISPQRRNTMQQWIGSGNRTNLPPINRPGYGARGRYAKRPYHHHRRHYPGWRPGWWTIPVAWGMGNAWWNWNTPDTYVYYNPYAVYVQDPVYDYSDPIYLNTDEGLAGQQESLSSTQSGATTEEVDSATTQAAMEFFEKARESFKDNNYQDALRAVDQAIEELPKDAALHEFRGLALFAQGKYNKAAAVINSVLASGPGWNWETMIGLYKNPEQYTGQLRNLEDFTRQHKKDAAAKFLLAYHYLVMGFTDKAATQLKEVVELQPKDVLAKRILEMITSAKKTPTEPVTPERPTPQG